jgi:hypothetical protein
MSRSNLRGGLPILLRPLGSPHPPVWKTGIILFQIAVRKIILSIWTQFMLPLNSEMIRSR